MTNTSLIFILLMGLIEGRGMVVLDNPLGLESKNRLKLSLNYDNLD